MEYKRPSRIKNACITYNNPSEHWDPSDICDACNYMVIGEEIGKSGTEHLQIYCEFKQQHSMKTIKELFGANVHIEKRMGTAKQAADYCKKDGKFHEIGSISKQGQRNDIHNLMRDIEEGKNEYNCFKDHFAQWKFYKAAQRFRYLHDAQDKKFQKMRVTVIWGKTGKGKSQLAHTIDPNLFRVPGLKPLWMDGYQGEETILLDDYYGEMPYSQLLTFTDGYKYGLPVKSSFTWKKYKHVIFTSNVHPSEWYPDEGKSEALFRRITEIIKF